MNINRTKKIIYTVTGLIILGLLGFFFYKKYLALPDQTTAARPGTTSGGVLPPPITPTKEPEASPTETLGPGEVIEIGAGQKLIRITDFPVVSPTLNKEGDKLLFYKKDGGGLFTSDFNGQAQEKISNLTILGMIEALWSPAKDRAAVFYLDQETLKSFLHIGTSSVAILPQNIKSFSWSPDGKSLAHLLTSNERSGLTAADSSGKNQKIIYATPLFDAQIAWVSADKIALQTAPSGLAPGYLFTLNKSSGAFNKVGRGFYGLTSLWSPDGTRVLISLTNSEGKNLKTASEDSSGKIEMELKIKTLAEKCVWINNKELYCAVPKFILPETIWPDDYLQGKINTADAIFYINLDQKEEKEILAEQEFDIANLLAAKNKDYLFFVDRITGSLWSLKMK